MKPRWILAIVKFGAGAFVTLELRLTDSEYENFESQDADTIKTVLEELRSRPQLRGREFNERNIELIYMDEPDVR